MNLAQKIISEIEKVLLGKPEAVRLSVSCLFSEGHLLIDDIPGVGKTTLAVALAKAMGGEFQRVQFTSDLLPSDLLGVSVFNQKTQAFDFKPGPLFNNVVLADEVNRASPKTQSALLECMQEKQVSLDRETHTLPKPFFVIATQNPHEHHGTFPLPESQLDRFMMRLNLGYPSEEIETAILRGDSVHRRTDLVDKVADPAALIEAIEATRKIKVDESLDRYIVQIAKETRESNLIDLGVSPRGTLSLRRAVQGFAFCAGRDYATPDDVKAVADPVLTHRLRVRGSSNGNGLKTAGAVLSEILNRVPVPA